jgi:hypothetical protein
MEEVVGILWPPEPAPVATELELSAAIAEAVDPALLDLAFKLLI